MTRRSGLKTLSVLPIDGTKRRQNSSTRTIPMIADGIISNHGAVRLMADGVLDRPGRRSSVIGARADGAVDPKACRSSPAPQPSPDEPPGAMILARDHRAGRNRLDVARIFPDFRVDVHSDPPSIPSGNPTSHLGTAHAAH